MPRFLVLSSTLLLMGLFMILLGMIIPAMALFPAPVALYWILGAYRRSLGLAAMAGCIATVGGLAFNLTFVTWLLMAAVALMGIPMATIMKRRMAFGAATLLLTALGAAWASAIMLLEWESYRENTEIFFSARVAQMEEAAQNNAASMEQNTAEMFRWFGENWENLVFGVVFGFMYIGIALAMALLRIPVQEKVRLRGALKDCRPPETLVLLAIALALMWMLDQWWWHTAPLRLLTWNGAMALMLVYLFNGFSILLYALHVFAAPPVVYAFIVVSVLLLGGALGLHPVFLGFGFFDTWFNFRKRFRILAKVQQLQNKDK